MRNFAEKLQAKANEFKANVDAAAGAQKGQIAQCLQVARNKAEQSKAVIHEKIAADRSEFQHRLDALRAKIHTKKAAVRSKADQAHADFQAMKAQWAAEDAEDYAAEALATAFFYIDEAEAAFIEAIAARLNAESLKP